MVEIISLIAVFFGGTIGVAFFAVHYRYEIEQLAESIVELAGGIVMAWVAVKLYQM